MSQQSTDKTTSEDKGNRWFSNQSVRYLYNLCFFAFLLILSFTVYSNTLHSSWHLDDFPNIVLNTKLHIQHLNFASIVQTFHSHPSFDNNAIYRPIVCFSFALNWLFGGEDVYSYHVINIFIHALAGFMVYLATLALLATPNIKNKNTNHRHSIAIIATCIWLLHPIQTQAVTYIVQRMALLAGLFYVTAFYYYITARLASNITKKTILSCLSLLAFMGGILSKENAIVFPLLIVTTEYIFFLKHNNKKLKKNFLLSSCLIGIISLSIAIIAYYLQPYRIEHLYSLRPYTLFQRIISENRILLLYLSQLFTPNIEKFSLFHDITLSVNLFNPVTTIPAILLNIFFIVFGIVKANKYPLLAFALLSYFCGHLVESTFLPLELMFEHRNYIPSMFIFVPIVAFAFNISAHKTNSTIFKKIIIPCAFVSLLLILGAMTYQRNKVWYNKETLWTDVYKKAPKNARPYQNLAMLFQEKGNYSLAIALYKDSLNKYDPSPAYSRYLVYNNLGTIYTRIGDYETAISYYQKAEKEKPGETKTLYNETLVYIQMGDFQTADKMLDRALFKEPNNYHFINTKGFLSLKQKKYVQALTLFRKSLSLRPFDKSSLLNLIMALSGLGEYERASWFLQIAEKQSPKDILFLLASIENDLRAKDHKNAAIHINNLVTNYSKQEVKKEIITSVTGTNTSPFNLDMLKENLLKYYPLYFE